MSFTVIDAPQRSPEWFAARIGRLTSSSASDVFKPGRGSAPSIARRDLRIRLALERMTNRTLDDDGFQTRDMQHGVESEGEARLAYETVTGQMVREAGFLSHNEHLAGCSLDGYVGDFEGVVEFKCPKSATHLMYLREQKVPDDYLHQINHHLWVTGAKWCDFVSFDDRLPEHLQLVILRVARHDVTIKAHENAVLAFLAEVAKEVTDIAALRMVAVA